jgi:two-component system LytT family sensor kinase
VGQQKHSIRYPNHFTLFLVWQALAIVSYARYAIESGPVPGNSIRHVLEWSTCYYSWFLLTSPLFRLERKFPLGGESWAKSLASLTVISLPISCLAYVGGQVLAAGISRAWGNSVSNPDALWHMTLRELPLEEAFFWSCMVAACVIRNLIDLQAREELATQLAIEKSELEASLRAAELETLRMRLNPHFLFNSLQNVSSLARTNPEAASRMVAKLGDVLRAALRKDDQGQSTLAAEIMLTKAYVSVEQFRLADRLSVFYEIEPGVQGAMVPGFILQPLVENAMTHGRSDGDLADSIWIRGFRDAQNLILTVSDNGSGPPTESLEHLQMGIGLGSTCGRLELMYPKRHSVSMQKTLTGGTEIRIALPYESRVDVRKDLGYELASIADRR